MSKLEFFSCGPSRCIQYWKGPLHFHTASIQHWVRMLVNSLRKASLAEKWGDLNMDMLQRLVHLIFMGPQTWARKVIGILSSNLLMGALNLVHARRRCDIGNNMRYLTFIFPSNFLLETHKHLTLIFIFIFVLFLFLATKFTWIHNLRNRFWHHTLGPFLSLILNS